MKRNKKERVSKAYSLGSSAFFSTSADLGKILMNKTLHHKTEICPFPEGLNMGVLRVVALPIAFTHL